MVPRQCQLTVSLTQGNAPANGIEGVRYERPPGQYLVCIDAYANLGSGGDGFPNLIRGAEARHYCSESRMAPESVYRQQITT
jgi:hypothetical protein